MDKFVAATYASAATPTTRVFSVVGRRRPRRGDLFLSGAIVEVYKAFNDLPCYYWVVEPVDTDTELFAAWMSEASQRGLLVEMIAACLSSPTPKPLKVASRCLSRCTQETQR